MIINNLQHQRKYQENTIPYLLEEFPHARIVASNHGWIVIPGDTHVGVIKLYRDQKIYSHELHNYNLLQKAGVLIPNIYETGVKIIGGMRLFFIRMENIRIYTPRITDIRILHPGDIAKILAGIHLLQGVGSDCLLHGNIHPSNFFLNENGKLGIFDLAGMLYGAREYDFASLYVHTDYDEILLNLVLNAYNDRDIFSYKRFYAYVMQMLVAKIQLQQPIRDEGVIGLKLALSEIIQKYKVLN